ncbi:MAG: ATP-binding cassette domain-containing protein [Planctomycetaceae bacterium]
MALLECTDLVKKLIPAVNGLFEESRSDVEPGEIVGLLGPNGAGKTTTFRMSCGLIAPTDGAVFLNGEDVTRWPMYQRARHGMGYLPQDNSIFVKLSVEQNIIAILEFSSVIAAKNGPEWTDELLEQFGLSTKRKQIASTLSGGERRRLEIARCLASRPRIILLDEPFTGIDPVTINSIQDIIADLRSQGIPSFLRTTENVRRSPSSIAATSLSTEKIVSGDAKTVLNDPLAQRNTSAPGSMRRPSFRNSLPSSASSRKAA